MSKPIHNPTPAERDEQLSLCELDPEEVGKAVIYSEITKKKAHARVSPDPLQHCLPLGV